MTTKTLKSGIKMNGVVNEAIYLEEQPIPPSLYYIQFLEAHSFSKTIKMSQTHILKTTI